ncbi:MAG TPA: nucleotidyl transferase AbiEii/AbiGii toxin family protein [Clostridiaceae bacterium]|nr:nucleotidyl transferase AbiEii/AbiGii toxin family protein [Clostridiaceae bacterium]
MIQTSRQLKDKIRNLSKEYSAGAQLLMRIYMMERLLERISSSKYKEHFILKGGVLVASLVGLSSRSTMDLDATVKDFPVNPTDVERMIQNIMMVPLEDGVIFRIKSVQEIMEEAEYPGVRLSIQAEFDGTRTPFKMDVSTGDVITPSAIQYSYPLTFEERSIKLLSYNLETVLAEKFESIVSKHVANTRMRDFYDVYILQEIYEKQISLPLLKAAIKATAEKRGTTRHMEMALTSLQEIEENMDMHELWTSFQDHNNYARDISWNEVMDAVKRICE